MEQAGAEHPTDWMTILKFLAIVPLGYAITFTAVVLIKYITDTVYDYVQGPSVPYTPIEKTGNPTTM